MSEINETLNQTSKTDENLSTLTEQRVQEYVNETIVKFLDEGGEPVYWKKSYYLLFAPVFAVLSLTLFIIQFQPSLTYSLLLSACVGIFAYFRYEQFSVQEIAIYPFALFYTRKKGLFEVETIQFWFGTESLKYMKVEPYTMEHLIGFMRIFSFLKPNRWFNSSNVYIYNADMRPVILPYVYQCDLFQTYLTKKIEECLAKLDANYKNKTGVVINNHLYEEIDGKLTRVDNF